MNRRATLSAGRLFFLFLLPQISLGQLYTEVNFADSLQPWHGFGVNYVEAAQPRDYKANPQDYGGFSYLNDSQKKEILELIFGEDGLKPGIVKMFLDPFHEPVNDNDNPYQIDEGGFDHISTTENMRYFVKSGLGMTRARNQDLKIITTLYGPPGWMTKQKFVRGRDLDPAMKYELGEYMISWVKYLKEDQGFPVRYLSLHNEGEAKNRWPEDGSTAGTPDHDYNLYWPKEQVVDFLRFMPGMMNHFGIPEVGITPGETTNWKYFSIYGYANEIALDVNHAFKNMDLVTSHSFYSATPSGVMQLRWVDRQYKTGRYLPVWVTSKSWSDMDVEFIDQYYYDIYNVGVNAIIPWAVIQVGGDWIGGDPNPGTAIKVDKAGTYEVLPGYYFFKQVSRAGQPGMSVVNVLSNEQDIKLMAFGANNTGFPNAFIVINNANTEKSIPVVLKGTDAKSFTGYRTSDQEHYQSLGSAKVKNGKLQYKAPPRSVTTFYQD